jgi:hypothetical protein
MTLPIFALAGGLFLDTPTPNLASGVVFNDLNSDGTKSAQEPGLPGVRVSNGTQITTTDKNGNWSLPFSGDCEFFVLKPTDWSVPVDYLQIPRYYYTHRPKGSRKSRYPGVSATGPLPNRINFPLRHKREPRDFEAIFFGDPQPRNIQDVLYLDRDVVQSLVGSSAAFGVTLGDIVFDNLNIFGPISTSISRIGIPWYQVVGNHDINRDTPKDELSNETFVRHFGPPNYSFDYGGVHFLTIDDVYWEWIDNSEAPGKKRGSYRAFLTEQVLAFCEADLKALPKEQLVVIMMHIPLGEISNREALFRLLEPFEKSFSISGHTHTLYQDEFDLEDGWNGKRPHLHIVNGAACGSWWTGEPGPNGVPFTTMRDGAPNGWSEIQFFEENGTHSWEYDYIGAGHEEGESMTATTYPQEDGSQLFNVNFWAGGDSSKVELQLWDKTWIEMKKVNGLDPRFVQLRAEDEAKRNDKWRRMPEAAPSRHLWQCRLPTGVKALQVRAIDRYGRTHFQNFD